MTDAAVPPATSPMGDATGPVTNETNTGADPTDAPSTDAPENEDAQTLPELAAENPEEFFAPGAVDEQETVETYTLQELAQDDPESFFNPGGVASEEVSTEDKK